jgi:hypothetical protein
MLDRHVGLFNTHAARLVANGFTVTPTRGKVPVVRKWQNQRPTKPDWLRKMLKTNRYADCNIGIVCGRVVGIDIDADEPAKAAQLETRFRTVEAARRTRQRTRQGETLSTYDARIVLDADGRVVDGREAFMAKLISAEFAKDRQASPDILANRVWGRFLAEADLSRPKGSNPKRWWGLKDVLSKARGICRKNPDLRPPRRSRGGHPASYLNAYRKPGFWTDEQRELHLGEAGRRIATPVVLAVERVMIEAVDLATGFCTMSIAKIAERAHCSTRSVTKARKELTRSWLWIAGPEGVFIPVALNRSQVLEDKGRKAVTGNTNVPTLYHQCRLVGPQPVSGPLPDVPQPYQTDLVGAPVPSDFAALVQSEMRARNVTDHELAAELGISKRQFACARLHEGGRCGNIDRAVGKKFKTATVPEGVAGVEAGDRRVQPAARNDQKRES